MYRVTDCVLRSDHDRKHAKMAEEAMRAKPNGELAELNEKIAAFEKEAGHTTSELIRRLETGRMQETPQILHWLMLAERRGLVQAR